MQTSSRNVTATKEIRCNEPVVLAGLIRTRCGGRVILRGTEENYDEVSHTVDGRRIQVSTRSIRLMGICPRCKHRHTFEENNEDKTEEANQK